MKKFAVACAAAALMSLAACGEKPAAEANNASNEMIVNDEANAANVADNAANATAGTANEMAGNSMAATSNAM